MYDDGMVTCKP